MASKKTRSKSNPQPAAASAADPIETVEVTGDAVVMDDAELDSLLASINEAEAAPVTAALEVEDDDVEAALRKLATETTEATEADVEKGDEEDAGTTATKAPRKQTIRTKTREFTDVAAIDPTVLQTNLAGCNAKKVNEKVQNVFQAIETGKKLSRYTKDAVALLDTAGRISGKTLVEEFRRLGLKDGTARAQAQQMTALFKMLGIVVPDASTKGELVASDTKLIKELMAVAA